MIKIAQRKVAEGDISGAVRVLSSQEGMADCTPENIVKLKEKHPDEASPIETECESADVIVFETSVDEVTNSIKHFLISSSGGDAAKKLIVALIALAKKNGDLRPITMGLVWRRLAGKVGVFSVKDSIADILAPIQKGFGIKGGAESIVHAVRTFIEAHHDSPTAILKFCFKNAFNELFRKLLLKSIKETARSLYPMLSQAYSCPSSLFFGDVIIDSKRGTQQGDPCASVAFCLAIMKLTHSLHSRLNAWFADDGTIGDNLETILDDVAKVLAFSDESGLTLNPTKYEVYFINTPPDLKSETLEKLSHLLPGIKVLDSFDSGMPIYT